MKLKDFIVSVLVDIDQGIKEAEQKTEKKHVLDRYYKNGEHGDKGVQFDVAVTASSEASGKIGAEVFSVGAKTEGKLSNEQVSRIKFTILKNESDNPIKIKEKNEPEISPFPEIHDKIF